jgi:hypothetical protein
MVAIAAVCGLSALLLVPGMYMYDLFVNGGGDDEFCGIGTNTVVFGYDLGCDVDWRQIFVVSGMVWFVGTVLVLPFVAAVSFIRSSCTDTSGAPSVTYHRPDGNDEKRGRDQRHPAGAPAARAGRFLELLTVFAIAAVCGLSALFLVPYDMYESFRYGVTDKEYCGGGSNTVLFGYDLGCDIAWRQIFGVSVLVWLGATAYFLPLAAAGLFILRLWQRHS